MENVKAHFAHLFSSDSGNWRMEHLLLFTGTDAIDQGHRLPRQVPAFASLIQEAPEIDCSLLLFSPHRHYVFSLHILCI